MEEKIRVLSLFSSGGVAEAHLEDLGIEKLRKNQENKVEEAEDLLDETEDSFDKIYKGEVSKSGTAILPSKRSKRMPEKIKIDLKNLKDNKEEKVEDNVEEKTLSNENESK